VNADAIIQKYWRAVDDLTNYQQDVLSDDAIRLAISLAVQDAYAAGGALADDLAAIVASHAQATPEQRQAEAAISQIGRLNEWLAEKSPARYADKTDTATAILDVIDSLQCCVNEYREDLKSARQELTTLIAERDQLRQQMVQMDADEAGLRRQVVELQREVDRLTRQNVIATDTFNSLAERTNGAAAVGHVSNVTEPQFEWWHYLAPETNDWRISLEAGRRTFRQVPRLDRLLLAQAVARHIGGGQMPKQADFDAARPDWMPTATGLVGTFRSNWHDLLALDPAIVAP
jgi:hypothetical protein